MNDFRLLLAHILESNFIYLIFKCPHKTGTAPTSLPEALPIRTFMLFYLLFNPKH